MASILDKAGTNVGNAYKLISASPLDVRFVVADIAERDSIITANGCYAGLEVWVENEQKKYIAVPNGSTFNWEEIATTADIPDISGKLDKTDYEWNKEIKFGSSGNLFIGSFPMYDSNVTVTISATSSLTYYGVLVLATQNAKKDNVGYYKATVYGDASNTVAPNIFIERVANSNIYNIYFKPLTYSKNLVHIQAAGLNTNTGYGDIAPDSVANICTSIDTIPETATIKPTNALTSKFLTSTDIPNITIADTGTKPIIGDITSSGHTITVSRIGLDDLGLASAYKYKGSVAAYANLPTTGNTDGDVYNVQTDGMNYAWTGSAWDALGGTVDLSGYTEGAASSTDNAIVRFDGTSGKKIQNSTVTIDDSGNTTLPINATLKLNTYGTRFLTLSGNNISADMSKETGGWAGAFASVKDPSGTTTTMLGWYGSTSLTHIYMGGAYNDPYMKMTASGLFTFKNQVTINAAQGTAPLAVTSTTVNTNLNADLLDGKHASEFSNYNEGVFYVEGTSETAGTWLGSNSRITEYYDGLIILYKINKAGASTTTLNINNLGAKTVYRYGSNKVTTHFPVNSIIVLSYMVDLNSGCWMVLSSYDSTNVDQLRPTYARFYTADALYDYKICGVDKDGRLRPLTITEGTDTSKTVNTAAIRPNEFYYYSTTTNVTAGSIVAANYLYNVYSHTTFHYTFNSTGTTYREIYLKGTLDSTTGLFTLDTTSATSWYTLVPYNTTITLSDYFVNGSYYILLGRTYSSNNYFTLFPNHPLYKFNGTNLKEIISEAVNADTLDGKHASEFQLAGDYLTAEADTLQTVTDRGASTTKSIEVAGLKSTGNVSIYAPSGATPYLLFQRGTETDSYNDWGVFGTSGSLYFKNRGAGGTWGNRVTFLQDGGITLDAGNLNVASGTATANSFIKRNSSDDYVLLAGGGTKLVSEIIESGSAGVDLSNYMPKAGGKFTGPISFQSSSLPEKTIEYITGIDGFADGGEMGWQSKSNFLSGYVTGTGLTANTIMLGNGSSKIKTSSKTIVTSITGSANVPTDSAVKTFVEGKGYVTTDTKNTAGSTNSESKLFLVGAENQAANPQTYSDAEVYTIAGQMNATSFRVNEKVIMQYNSTDKCLEFAF